MKENEDQQDLPALLDFLKRNRGFDFTGYKTNSLVRRIQKRMKMVEVEGYSNYIDFLEVHPEEFTQLFNTILINVTGFFRDPLTWDYLKREVIPAIIANKRAGEAIRVWSTGCASGEEAYSIAMLFAEALGEEQFRERVKIYATDVDEEALNKARAAIYSEREVVDVPKELLEKYFTRMGSTFNFDKELRRNLIFGRNDVIQDAPISRVDLLVCRNTVMYFNAETQAKILARFHFALNDNGFLFLGKAEMLLTHTNTFTPVDLKLRIFNKVPRANMRDRILAIANTQNINDEGMNHMFGMMRLRDMVFETSKLAQLIIDANNVLLLINEHARIMFNVNPRDIGQPFQDLELSYKPVELRSSIQRAYSERVPVQLKNIEWLQASGDMRYLDIRVQPLLENGNAILGACISFDDMTQYTNLQNQLESTNNELETAFEELQSTNEELETTNEELQSTIEELETTNEELQSTNEELETMNEELQSTNEELQTINDELRQRTDDLNQVNAFMESVLTSVQVGVVVLDKDFRVQVWNRKAEDMWGLRREEVEGKNFMSLDIGLPVEHLKRPIISSLSGEDGSQELMLKARNRRGREFQCKTTVSPLMGREREIRGVIAVLEDNGSTK